MIAGMLGLVGVLVGLGIWQLQRGDSKAALLAALDGAERIVQLPRLPAALPQRIELRGSLLSERYFLLDNRIRGGKVGYEVLGVLAPASSSQYLLVNLGWIAAPAQRERLPRVNLPLMAQSYGGWLVSNEAGFRLDRASFQLQQQWPQRVQQADVAELSAMLGLSLYPALLQLDHAQVAGLSPQWQPVNMPPVKHYAYALQWFALALMTLLWLGWWSRRVGR